MTEESNTISWSSYYITTDLVKQALVQFTLIAGTGASANQVQVTLTNGGAENGDSKTLNLVEGVSSPVGNMSYKGGVTLSGNLKLDGGAVHFDGSLSSAELNTSLNGMVGSFGGNEDSNMSDPFLFEVIESASEKWGLSFGLKWNNSTSTYSAQWTFNGVEGTAPLDENGNGSIVFQSGDLSANGNVFHAFNAYNFGGSFIRSGHAQLGFDNATFSCWKL